ncbi:Leucine-rich repeat receptor-like protein kinase pxc1 [Thalictrum thalictroides]|uniref:Leucine-rich repeat receptor-like protein kinase pxc1 n=1 Tax=Thalictrum thalictroides TaxID=46969 RepID=A0A7J6WNU2_THATH|nr:Leucine-rich repeat receptor-like protein kinase pxc1 [Thalictrum thalictroides]
MLPPPPPPSELHLEVHSIGSPTIDDSLLVKIGGSSSLEIMKMIPQFKFKDLLRATAEALGSGDFGRTYKQVLKSSNVVCVSSLEKIHDETNLQEKLHLYLGRLRHENLVSLKTYYFSAEEKMLVSEYMPNGSLFSILHSNRNHHKRIPLD